VCSYIAAIFIAYVCGVWAFLFDTDSTRNKMLDADLKRYVGNILFFKIISSTRSSMAESVKLVLLVALNLHLILQHSI